MTPRHLPLLSVAFLTAAAPLAPAQVPEGYAVVGTATENGSPGISGLFLVPLTGGPTTPITGLPPELSTVGNNWQGTHYVSVRSSDGAVVVTTASSAGSPTGGNQYLFVLHLSGTAVLPALTQQILLGTATADSGVRHALLPDGRVLVHAQQGGTSPLPSGPMANHRWAIVNPNTLTPTITVLPEPPGIPGQFLASVAVDPTGRYAYYTLSENQGAPSTNASLLRLDLATGAECTIANWPGESAFGVVVDDDGVIYVSSTNVALVEHYIHTVVPDGCNLATVTTVQSSLPILARGLALDRASGNFVAASLWNVTGFSGPQLNALSLVDRATGEVTVLSTTPAGGWGTIGWAAVNNAMEPYGRPTDGQNRYWFTNFPNPTGHPYVGNTGFSLTTAAAPGGASLSLLAVSLGRSSTLLLGAEYLLEPASAVVALAATTNPMVYPLPIPNVVGLAGVLMTAQSLHLEPRGSIAASRGLELIVQLLPKPTIDAVQPSAPQPNATVTVTGRNFYGGMQLRAAGSPTPITSQTPTTVTFTMPAGVPCNSSLSLINLGGATGTATLNGTPVITSMPTSGPAAGNALFTVQGQFLDGAVVTFSGAPLSNLVSQTTTEISGYTPPGAVGPAVVVVTSATGCQTTAAYTYHALPTITSITPAVAGPGVPVTITGENFLSGLTLTVGGNPTAITSWNASTITFQMPAGTSCDTAVEVTNVGNFAASRVINRTPVVGLYSTSGLHTGNQLFYLTGQYLQGATVTINGQPLVVTSQTATSIVGLTPPGPIGPTVVTVSNAVSCATTVPYSYF